MVQPAPRWPETLRLRLDAETHAKLREVAERHNVSVSAVARDAIARGLTDAAKSFARRGPRS